MEEQEYISSAYLDASCNTTDSATSSQSFGGTMDSDWMKWPRDDLPFDPLFALAGEDLSLTDDISTEAIPKDIPVNHINPDLLRDILTTDNGKPEMFLCPPSSSESSAKRKMSDSSDNIFDRHSISGTSLSSVEHGSSAEEPATKKRAGARGPKVSHNVIEKRYRSNLNDKIFELRDTVPDLKAEVDAGNTKQPKGKIITGATNYIRQLEATNRKLRKENERLTAKLHHPDNKRRTSTASKVMVGGLAGMVALSGMSDEGHEHSKRSMSAVPIFHHVITIAKVALILGAVLYVLFPNLTRRSKKQQKYSQSSYEDCMQEDVQEHREAFHSNVSAMLEMPCDRPGLFKRILQGLFLLSLEIMLGESWWNKLINRGLDYAMTRQRACQMLIESQLLGGDKSITKSKLLLSAIQSLGYKMNKEMRAIHFAMVCHNILSASMIRWCIQLFWNESKDDTVLAMPLAELLDSRILEAFWHWTTGVNDGLISNIRSDSTIDTPLRQLSAIHAARLQSEILREWLRGVVPTSELNAKMDRLMRLAPPDSKVMTNSLYLRSMIEPNDWLERAMLAQMPEQTLDAAQEVSTQLRCAVLLNLVERDVTSEEIADIYEMAEVTTSSTLPGYSSRMITAAITKHKLDDDEGIAEALRRIYTKIGKLDTIA